MHTRKILIFTWFNYASYYIIIENEVNDKISSVWFSLHIIYIMPGLMNEICRWQIKYSQLIVEIQLVKLKIIYLAKL